ncbi:MAG TPA: DUF1569 domain-containing protein [Gemmatimonadales bacterium]|nr:DUF1569 domain-containing protein [Gemmatimonadales bacterium]
MTRFAELPEFVLGPLTERPDADWYRSPPGKWNTAQIVEHLALGIEWSVVGFDERRARDPMVRRPRSWFERGAYLWIMSIGWFPPGFKAPSRAVPAAHVDRGAAEAHFRAAHARATEMAHLLLPARGRDLFVKHPRMGDLTLPEWLDFHVIHARHHVRQIRRRIAA